MYFHSIDIKNYGSIYNFHYQFRFDKNAHPIPLALIGENGTGKTLAITNMVDALIEIKRNTYGEMLSEVREHNYYKIGSKNYILNGHNTSQVVIHLRHGEKSLKYTDIMSNDPNKINEESILEKEAIIDNSSFYESGYYKEATSSLKRRDYSDFVNLYFPADRFYIPMWYNNDNYKRIDYSKRNNINQPDTNIIKVDILSNIKDWLTYIYLQTTFQLIQVADSNSVPSEVRGKQVQLIVETNIQSVIKKVMNAIVGTNNYQPRVPDRRNQTFSFTMPGINCNDISQLSEGQISLFAIALSIIKEWDITHENFELEDISGCVIIDEADLGMHINYMHDYFPRMMKLFPNIQFIITTHSPFMIAGLSQTFGDDIDIITMPDGLKISDVNAFTEVQKSQELVYAGISEIRNDVRNLKEEVAHLRQANNKVYLYTEGGTDALLIEKALNKLNIDDLHMEIRPASQKKGKNNDESVKKLLELLQENPCGNNTVIGIFDRDSKAFKELAKSHNNHANPSQDDFIKLNDHIFAFMLPVPHNRPEIEQISIEHYFTDEEIKTENEQHQRLFLGKEFYPSGNHIDDSKDYNYKNAYKCYDTIKIIEHEQNAFVTDRKGEGDYSLSKQRFAEAVRDDRPGFENFNYSEFNKIFDVIRMIIESEKDT